MNVKRGDLLILIALDRGIDPTRWGTLIVLHDNTHTHNSRMWRHTVTALDAKGNIINDVYVDYYDVV